MNACHGGEQRRYLRGGIRVLNLKNLFTHRHADSDLVGICRRPFQQSPLVPPVARPWAPAAGRPSPTPFKKPSSVCSPRIGDSGTRQGRKNGPKLPQTLV